MEKKKKTGESKSSLTVCLRASFLIPKLHVLHARQGRAQQSDLKYGIKEEGRRRVKKKSGLEQDGSKGREESILRTR